MKISELERVLAEFKNQHGDIEVWVHCPYYAQGRMSENDVTYFPKGLNSNSLVNEAEERLQISLD